MDDPDLLRLRADFAALCFERAMLKLELAIKYDDNQPRNPAGSPEGGGRWAASGGAGGKRPVADAAAAPAEAAPAEELASTWKTVAESRNAEGLVEKRVVVNGDGVTIASEFPAPGAGFDVRHTVRLPDGTVRSFETTGAVQTIYDESGKPLSSTAWTRNGPQAMDTLQPALLPILPVAPFVAEKTIVAALALYGFYLTLQAGGRPVIAYPPRLYERDAKQPEPIFVGLLTDEEVRDTCKRYVQVQGFTDNAVQKLNRRDYTSAATYGTAVHMEVRNKIREVNNRNFLAEISLMKTRDETGQPPDEGLYGKLGSIRIDAFENTRRGTVCVYDIKTGIAGLLPGRSKEIAGTVRRNFDDVHWIIVTEVRRTR